MKPSRKSILGSALSAVVALTPVAAAAATDYEKAASRYEEALGRFAEGDIPTTVILLKNALQQNPKFVPAYLLMAKAYLRAGQGAAAEEMLQRANDLGADWSLTVLPLAQSYLQQRKFQEVVIGIRAAAYAPPIRSRILVYQGQAHLQLREFAKAMQAFADALGLDPGSVAAVIGQATVLLRAGRIDAAEEEARRATDLAPRDAAAWYVRAAVSHAQGNLDEAAAGYTRVLELEPRHVDARVARAGVYMDLGQDTKAEADLETLRAEYPLEPRAAYMRAVLLARRKDAEGSEAALREVTEILKQAEPEFLRTQTQLLLLGGLAHYSLGELEQAERYLGGYVRAHPRRVGARKVLASIMISRGNPKQAIDILEPARADAPDDYRLLSLLATAYMRTGAHAAAVPLLERAERVSAGAAEIRTQLALSRLGSGDEAQAIEGLISVFDEDSTRKRVGVVLAVMRLRRGEYAEAIRIAQTLVDREPTNLTAYNLLGSAQVSAGRRQEARATYEKAVALDPTFLPARINLAKLELLEGEPEKARDRLLRILDEYPEHQRPMVELARVEEAQGRIEPAIRWLQKARGDGPGGLRATLALVEVYLRNGQPDAALATAAAAEARAPEDLDVLAAVGRSELAAGKGNLATVTFRRMARLASFDSERLVRIAGYQMAAGSVEDAVFSLRKAVQGDPDSLPAQVALTEAHLRAGQVEEARAQALALRARYPERAVGYRLLGDVFAAGQLHDQAGRRYEEALARGGGARVAIKLFVTRRAQGAAAQGLRELEAWVEANPGEPLSKAALAESYLRAGRLADAQRLYEQILAERPNAAGVLNNLAYIFGELGDPRALRTAERANRIAPEDPAISDTLGWLLVQQGQAAKGLPYLRQARARAAGAREIRYHIAVALADLNRPAEAATELEEALAGTPEFPGVEDARRLLQRLRQSKSE